MQNHSYENVFYLYLHCHAKQAHFHVNSFALGLVLKLKEKGTRKWPITVTFTLVYDCLRLAK